MSSQVSAVRSQVADPEMAAAIEAVAAGFDRLAAAGFDPVDSRDAVACVREFEVLRRRADQAAVGVLGAIDRRGLFRDDGHGSARTMVRHVAKLSGAEASGRAKTAKMCAALPEVADAYARGEVGTDQIRLLGRVHANPRVANLMEPDQGWFLAHATRRRYTDFARVVRVWEELSDPDGAAQANEVAHENRNVQLVQLFDKTWDLKGRYGALQGAANHDILRHYTDAELKADWEKARAEHGDAACTDHLERTDAQRRADALWHIFQDAATNPSAPVPVGYVHNIVWNHQTFEHTLARLAGEHPGPLHPDDHRCETIDGKPLEPIEAAVNAIVSQVRRVLIDAKSCVIDLGEPRFFTGHARHAIHLASTTCVWPGCHAPTTNCEADHLHDHAKGGQTNPANGAPLCGKHNRWKQKGFTIWRDPTGTWHTTRPDGTQLE